ncbi:MAG: hypothetical protein WCK34_01820 [Bacteroidota bacterium]
MKRLIAVLIVVFIVGQSWAQTPEYLLQKDFRTEKQKIYDGISATKKQLNEVKKGDLKMERSADSLKRMIGYCTGQLGMTTDSLKKTCAKLNALQEKVDSQKFLSRRVRVLIALVLLILFGLLFILVFLFKRKSDANYLSAVELNKQTNEHLEIELANFKGELLKSREQFAALSNEMNQLILNGLNKFETQNRQLEQHLHENLARVEERIDPIGAEINKIREDQAGVIKTLTDSMNAIRPEMDKRSQSMAADIAKLGEELKSLKGKP